MTQAKLLNSAKGGVLILSVFSGIYAFGASSQYGTLPSTSGSASPLARMEFGFKSSAAVNDFRPQKTATSIGPGMSPDKAVDTIKLNQSTISLQTSMSDDPETPLDVGVGMRINSIYSSSADVVQATEFESFQMFVNGSLRKTFGYTAGFDILRSPKNNLFSDHTEFYGGIYLQMKERADGVETGLRIGPEVVVPANSDYAYATYDVQWGLSASLSSETNMGEAGKIRFDAKAIFRRLNDHKISGVSQGGAGYLGIKPELSYLVIEETGLWLGAFFEAPLVKPNGQEGIFGNVSYPGLMGKAFGITLSIAAM
jgi:hypothetical protein